MSLLVTVPVILPAYGDEHERWNHRPHHVRINRLWDAWRDVADTHDWIATLGREGENQSVAASWNDAFYIAQGTDIKYVALCSHSMKIDGGTAHLAAVVDKYADERGLLTDFVFHCIVLSVALFQHVGSFDEEFRPAYYEDSDYLRRMFLAGIHTPACPMPKVGRDVLDGTDETAPTWKAGKFPPEAYGVNHQRYLDKWGGEPFEEQYRHPFDALGVRCNQNWKGAELFTYAATRRDPPPARAVANPDWIDHRNP